ncbi:hypothetical protein DFH06DRAFT_1143784 [Mycena polygramma]|nr:hypothetical protein DFH06DRAFT_1143784 [Mycena polygramma]
MYAWITDWGSPSPILLVYTPVCALCAVSAVYLASTYGRVHIDALAFHLRPVVHSHVVYFVTLAHGCSGVQRSIYFLSEGTAATTSVTTSALTPSSSALTLTARRLGLLAGQMRASMGRPGDDHRVLLVGERGNGHLVEGVSVKSPPSFSPPTLRFLPRRSRHLRPPRGQFHSPPPSVPPFLFSIPLAFLLSLSYFPPPSA